ncbi:hypothetical protein [Helicobacter pylori]|uniref:hypothetical protein n=1 Tax=Helicobacter pylori TaxID=210 RepID=UPI001F221ACE|nr:hypothetical protein [Helicobacter pylori]
MNVLIRLCFILVIGFFSANKTLNATTIPSLDFGSSSMPITANFSDGVLDVFKWFEKHPSVGYKVGRLAKQDDSDTILNLVIIVIVVAIIALIAIFIRSILLNIIFMGSVIGSLWLYMVVFYYLYGVSFLDYSRGCYELFSFSACYPHSLQLLPAFMQYSPIYSITKLLAYFNIEITSKIIISLVWVCIGLYFLLLQAFCSLVHCWLEKIEESKKLPLHAILIVCSYSPPLCSIRPFTP